jgi:GNAT superfamily N-acetyltransferase
MSDANLPATHALRDGRVVTIAARSPADDMAVHRLLDALGDTCVELFDVAARAGGALVARCADGELAAAVAWTAADGLHGECVGVVDPAFCGLGLGTQLLRRCSGAALSSGVTVLRVQVNPGADDVAAMLRDCGLHTHWDLGHPAVQVDVLPGTQRPGWATP